MKAIEKRRNYIIWCIISNQHSVFHTLHFQLFSRVWLNDINVLRNLCTTHKLGITYVVEQGQRIAIHFGILLDNIISN